MLIPPIIRSKAVKFKKILNRDSSQISTQATLFYVTQHKCGSQWLAQILRWFAYDRYVVPMQMNQHFLNPSIGLVKGKVYPTLYINKNEFDEVLGRNPDIVDFKLFVVIRDLRDVLASLYFSVKYSHPLGYGALEVQREALNKMDLDDGLRFMMDHQMEIHFDRQVSWLESNSTIYKFEDLISNEDNVYSLLDNVGIHTSRKYFDTVMEKKFRFAKLAGRSRGDHDKTHHYRKGISGDWENHFSPSIKREFKQRYNKALVLAGYEIDDMW